MSDLSEVKALIEQQGSAWEQFKKANDARLEALEKKGYAPAETTEKVEKLSKALDDVGTQLDDVQKKLNRPSSGAEDKDLATEVKSFNVHMQSDFAARGKKAPAEMSTEGYVLYKSGLLKHLRGQSQEISAEEQKAMLAGSDPDGGYLLTPTVTGRMVARLREYSIMRQLASVQSISGPALEGVADTGEADAGWVSEIGSRTETTSPTVGKYRIEPFEMYAAPKVTQTLVDDAAVDIEAWLGNKIADKFSRVEGTAFWSGTGVGQPRGLSTYTTAATGDDTRTWGTMEHVVTGANGDFHTTKADPLFDLQGQFRNGYLNGASFVMRRSVRTKIRKLKEATTDRYLWEPSLQQGVPDRLLGFPAYVDEYMPTLATGSLSLAFGDFRECYQIVDRIGVRVLRDPYTSKPYIILYTTKRVGGGVVNSEAVKFLKFST